MPFLGSTNERSCLKVRVAADKMGGNDDKPLSRSDVIRHIGIWTPLEEL
jgi:hypothetical protein